MRQPHVCETFCGQVTLFDSCPPLPVIWRWQCEVCGWGVCIIRPYLAGSALHLHLGHVGHLAQGLHAVAVPAPHRLRQDLQLQVLAFTQVLTLRLWATVQTLERVIQKCKRMNSRDNLQRIAVPQHQFNL